LDIISLEEKILQAAKEITVKFIEVGRVSPTTFAETFQSIYNAVRFAVLGGPEGGGPDDRDTGSGA